MDRGLPRVLVVTDVAVELMAAGSTLLYRLLENYPKDNLCIVQTSPVNQSRAIKAVKYFENKSRLATRLKKTRFYAVGSLIEFKNSLFIGKTEKEIIRNFRPEAILTVTFRFSWIKAYFLSRKYKLPLHLILHDDILTAERHGSLVNRLLRQGFKKVYRYATSRMCISPNMEAYYKQLFGIKGDILYPSRGINDTTRPVPERIKQKKSSLHFCYAGSLHTTSFVTMLNQLAAVLYKENCRLTIFSDADKAHLQKLEWLGKEHVTINGFVHPDDLKEFLYQQADVNIMLNSFEDSVPFRYNFSSKMVDYSATGLPVLMWGPEESAVMKWALQQQYPLALTTTKQEDISNMLHGLKNEDSRYNAAMQVKQLGDIYFSYEKNFSILANNLRTGIQESNKLFLAQ
jgi:glycosyltransferase involved in cell wall biosynthesis